MSKLRNLIADAIDSTDDPATLGRLKKRLNDATVASYARSVREPIGDLFDERDAANDALGTIFEMQVGGYVPEAGVIKDLELRRDACELEINARQTAPRADWSGRLEAIEEMRLR